VIEAAAFRVMKTIDVGTEPFGCALTPDGKRLYVANQSSDTVSVIDTGTDVVVRTIEQVGPKPHALAITADGKKIYVTHFLAQVPGTGTHPLTQSEGADDGREGRVTVIDRDDNRPPRSIVLKPLVDVGAAFKSNGNTLARQPLSDPPAFDNPTGAFPNLLESIVIRGNIAYVPNTCSSPNGPFRFNVSVQGCLSAIDTVRDVEAFPTLNMNAGVNLEPVGKRLFSTNPVAIAFKHAAAEGFVALGATNRLLRVTVDEHGVPTINPPQNASDLGNIVRIELKGFYESFLSDPRDTIGGKNPRGIVIDSSDHFAYVMDFVSRDVAIVDVFGNDPTQYLTATRFHTTALPPPGSVDAIVLRGKQLFNTAIGPEGTQANSIRPAGLMSDTGWGTCYSCHPQGLTDGVTWMFADGPRQSISLEATFESGAAAIVDGAPALPASHQRALNWSAVRDEVQDFERNIRAVSGGGGLIPVIPEGPGGLDQVPDLVPIANTGRSADLDAIATYLALGVRAPISVFGGKKLEQGRALFEEAGCQNCHGGRNWTIGALDFTPPPAPSEIVDNQLGRFLCRVGTFDPGLFADGVSNEIRANNAANVPARGVLGFDVPSLVSVFASAPYLHSGTAPNLAAVLENVTHRSAGRPDHQDVLTKKIDRKSLVRFLQSIDRSTEPFLNVSPSPAACGTQ
jgi:YVTN family beta-propeller protein